MLICHDCASSFVKVETDEKGSYIVCFSCFSHRQIPLPEAFIQKAIQEAKENDNK